MTQSVLISGGGIVGSFLGLELAARDIPFQIIEKNPYIASKDDHVILGIQAVGSHVAELHGEFILALEMGALLEDISDTVHAHPTMTEAFHESVLKTLGHAIHTS